MIGFVLGIMLLFVLAVAYTILFIQTQENKEQTVCVKENVKLVVEGLAEVAYCNDRYLILKKTGNVRADTQFMYEIRYVISTIINEVYYTFEISKEQYENLEIGQQIICNLKKHTKSNNYFDMEIVEIIDLNNSQV